MTAPKQVGKLDPLYTIFEQHLYNFQDSEADRKTFIGQVVAEYLTYLRRLNIVIPTSLENLVIEELGTQVNTMLVKKIYGCLTVTDYQRKVPSPARRRARANYTRLHRGAARAIKPKTTRNVG